ncbi:V-set and immunoglobulin domain-containing protein 10 [Astyanax mexicanus]|nr:V-set and immunoglobulin domain-containing protein 10 [Astyanax mexicanus]
MKSGVILFLLFFFLSSLSAGAGGEQEEVVFIGEKGKSILLPCLGLPDNAPLLRIQWNKSGEILVSHVNSQPLSSGHLSVLKNGSLSFTNLMLIDEAVYRCVPVPRNDSLSRNILLQVADGPAILTADIKPATRLSNGTLYVQKGSDISFECSSESYPSQNLTWVLDNAIKASITGSSLNFKISNLQPADQGIYTCRAQNLLSNRTATWTQELLVYYVPDRHPNCSWEEASSPDLVHFNCSWFGGYPVPTLQVFLASETDAVEHDLESEITENIGVTLNRTMLHDGQKITCKGQHTLKLPGSEKSCSFILKAPYPVGEPLVATVEGSNLTLSCTEDKSLPPAKTVWQKGKNQENIVPSSKYIINIQGPVITLTIVNITKEDEGVFYCWSENVVAAKELPVYVTVKSFADRSGVVVGLFISVVIVVAGVTLGILAYSRRDRICLSFGFSAFEEDRTDVLSLVESDEEEVFHGAVPRLPPLSNGYGPTHTTTMVEIHRIQSSDHEDNVNDTDQAEE